MSWLEELDWECVKTDLFDEDADAIVVPVNIHLDLHYGLGTELLRREGEPLLEAVAKVREGTPELALGHAVHVPLRQLRAKHAILVAWWGRDNDYTANHLYRCYAQSLRQAFAVQAESLSMPMLGGRGGVSDTARAKAVVELLRSFDRLKGSDAFPTRTLRFVDVTEARLSVLDDLLERTLYLPG